MKVVLIQEAARVTVELRDDQGERFGVHWFKTMDAALEWMERMRMKYVMELPRAAG